MRVAVDPHMLRAQPVEKVFETISRVGYPWMELSPRADILPLFTGRRAGRDMAARVRRTAADSSVGIASVWVVYRWSSPDRDEREAAVRYWLQAIDLAVELGCDRLNTELSGDPLRREASEAALWRSLDVIVPRLEAEGLTLSVEPHPGDLTEDGQQTLDLLRGVRSRSLRYLHCAPHTFHLGASPLEVVRAAGDDLGHVHLADTFRPDRIVVNPPDAAVSVHQHLDIGQGEVDFEALFRALADIGFDGVLTTSVFFWDERAEDSFRHNLAAVRRLMSAVGLALTVRKDGHGAEIDAGR